MEEQSSQSGTIVRVVRHILNKGEFRMKIILKHKKTFIVIVIISLLISILPLIGMATFMGVRSSNVNIAYESPVVENLNPIDYLPVFYSLLHRGFGHHHHCHGSRDSCLSLCPH